MLLHHSSKTNPVRKTVKKQRGGFRKPASNQSSCETYQLTVLTVCCHIFLSCGSREQRIIFPRCIQLSRSRDNSGYRFQMIEPTDRTQTEFLKRK
jgi:hypothetical protein